MNKLAATVLVCRRCHDDKKPWGGVDAFANDDGVYLYCRGCKAFLCRAPCLAIMPICDLCREGTEHEHTEYKLDGDQLGVPPAVGGGST